MQCKFELLKKGDSVLNVWESNIAIQRKNGDVEVFRYCIDENGLPRLSENTMLITQGRGSVTVKSNDSSIEVTTFWVKGN